MSQSQSSEGKDEARSGAKVAIAALSLNQVPSNSGRVSPSMFQLKTSWHKASEQEKEVYIEKATEACNLVCDVIKFQRPDCNCFSVSMLHQKKTHTSVTFYC